MWVCVFVCDQNHTIGKVSKNNPTDTKPAARKKHEMTIKKQEEWPRKNITKRQKKGKKIQKEKDRYLSIKKT